MDASEQPAIDRMPETVPEGPQPSAGSPSAAESKPDAAERPGTSDADHQHDDDLADEWGRESFPSSDPPAHY